MSNEEWRAIPGYEDSYEVSSLGRVRSLAREVAHPRMGRMPVRGRVLKSHASGPGYPSVSLYAGGIGRGHFVHRLVLTAFDPRVDADEMQVNHIDGDKTNSALGNLEWVTPSENMEHAVRMLGFVPPVIRGSENANARAVLRTCPRTGEERTYSTLSSAVADGCEPNGIVAACTGRQRTHRGFFWRYLDAPSTAAHNDCGPSAPASPRRGLSGVRPVEQISQDGSVVRRYPSISAACAEGFKAPGIVEACKGRKAKHRGFGWRYAPIDARAVEIGGRLWVQVVLPRGIEKTKEAA